jgi:threonine/homoserine/homoserine lactone efflux protein
MNTSDLLLFAVASLVLVATPGPGVLYVVARSISQGRRAGLASVLGLGIGDSIHAVAAAVGLSALLASSPLAFSVVKYSGAAYLAYLALRKLLDPCEFSFGGNELVNESFGATLRRAVIVAVLNPKTAMFFLAFPPQFVDPAGSAVGLQLLILGGITVSIGALSDSTYVLLSSAFGPWLKRSRGFARAEPYVLSAIYGGLAAMAAFSGPPSSM